MVKRAFCFPICVTFLALLCFSISASADNTDLSATAVVGDAFNPSLVLFGSKISALYNDAKSQAVSMQTLLGEVPWGLCVSDCQFESAASSSLKYVGDASSDLNSENSDSAELFAPFHVAGPGSMDNIDLGSPRLDANYAAEASVLPLNGNIPPDRFVYLPNTSFPLQIVYVGWPWQVCVRNCGSQGQGAMFYMPPASTWVDNFRGQHHPDPGWGDDKHHHKLNTVPEPSSLILLGTGFLGIACGLKRRSPR